MKTNLEKIKILLIEDNPADVRLLTELLKKAKDFEYALTSHSRLSEGLNALEKTDFNVLLLDLTLPDSDGKSTLENVLELSLKMPIIILTGLNEKEMALESLKKGAQDYLVKGELDSALLTRSILYAIERHRIEHKKVKEKLEQNGLDEKDKEILNLLQENHKISYSELSNIIGLAASTIHNRVQNMVKDGIIKGFHTHVDPFKVGYKNIAILGLSVNPIMINEVSKQIAAHDEVQLVASSTGDHDILVQVVAKNEKDLWRFINKKIKVIEGVNPQLHVSDFIDIFKMTHKIHL
ncbi:MAG: response regulator [Candidatus Lokiarchaeota archaeon]|nr:response regulator [Candidatus Lokiarchaeota archaeon]